MKNSIKLVASNKLLQLGCKGNLPFIPIKAEFEIPKLIKFLPRNFKACFKTSQYIFQNYFEDGRGAFICFDGVKTSISSVLDDFCCSKIKDMQFLNYGYVKYGRYPTPFYAKISEIHLDKKAIDLGISDFDNVMNAVYYLMDGIDKPCNWIKIEKIELIGQ